LRFSNKEIQYLKKNCKRSSYKELANHLNRDKNVIASKCKNLGFTQIKEPRYTQKEEEFIINNLNYNDLNKSIKLIAKALDRTVKGINRKITNMGIRKNKRWTNTQVEFLKNNTDLNIKELSTKLDKSEKSIKSKLWRLK